MYVSDSQFEKSDYDQWLDQLKKDNIQVPTMKEVKKKQSQINSILHYNLTDEEVQQIVKEKDKFRKKPVNFALTKSEIEKQISEASERNDRSAVEKLVNKLGQLEKECNAQIMRQNSRVEGLFNLNKRNRKQNLEISVNKNNDKIEEEDNSNPFRRQLSRPSVVANKHTAQSARDKMNNDTQAMMDSALKKNKSLSETNDPKTLQSTNIQQDLHDFEINIDIDDDI